MNYLALGFSSDSRFYIDPDNFMKEIQKWFKEEFKKAQGKAHSHLPCVYIDENKCQCRRDDPIANRLKYRVVDLILYSFEGIAKHKDFSF